MSGRRREQPAADAKPQVRCAIYTRKSTEEGLEQEFNSLDAQRESAEAYIASQKAEGWRCLPDRYDDGGFSGGSMERPALDRLLKDIDADKIDCVVVYKVDRLSRSLMDFSRIMETFDRQKVSFVSVTQAFNTRDSMGRLMLNVLLSFAQFEREIIGERIRDKIGAQKRKGKWAGGVPVLGYDVDRSGPSPKLVVNAKEAARARQIFELYLEKGSLLPVVTELERRGWANKTRVTKKGEARGGRPFDRNSLHQSLTNPIYVGRIVHKGASYAGEHEAIIDAAIFDRVQVQLKGNGRGGGTGARNKYGALLRGLLRCKSCGQSMTHTFTGGRDGKSYRYYRCIKAIKSGSATCPSGTVPAAEIERVVVDEVRALATDKALIGQVLAEAQGAAQAERTELETERRQIATETERHHRELGRLAARGPASAANVARIAGINERLAQIGRRASEVDAGIVASGRETITRAEAEAAFADFNGLWSNLIPREQARLLRLLVATVDYDADAGSVAVDFRPTSIRTLAALRVEEAA